jgi:hypothetical protein
VAPSTFGEHIECQKGILAVLKELLEKGLARSTISEIYFGICVFALTHADQWHCKKEFAHQV